MPDNKWVVWGVIAIIAMSVASVLLITHHGSGMSPDSVVYVAAAEQLAAGEGLTVPFGENPGQALIHFPPLFPLVLAFFDWVGIGTFWGSRILNASLLAGSTSLIFIFLNRLQPSSPGTLLASILFILFPLVLMIHSMAWSEPLFLFLMLLSMLTLGRGIIEGNWHSLIVSALLAGFASLTRYAGLALLIAGGLALFIGSADGWAQRFKRAAFYFIVGFIPLFVWLARNIALFGAPTNRELSVHFVSMNHLWQLVGTVASWFFIPTDMPGVIKVTFLTLLSFSLGWCLWGMIFRSTANAESVNNDQSSPTRIHILILIIYALTYLGFLLFSISFIDANTPLDDRILSPILVFGFLLISIVYIRRWRWIWKSWISRLVFVLPLAILLVLSSQATVRWSTAAYLNGLGFNHSRWRMSELIARLGMLEQDATIYSNSPEGVYLHTGRSAYSLPRAVNKVASEVNEDLQEEISVMSSRLRADEGYLIYFTLLQSDSWMMPQDLADTADLVLLYEDADGYIFSTHFERELVP
jgi:4-amino-4-deoxy-L-arabinose transferase-like glycosyltransferase